jgi:holo-[acyl-carrier protein] synthase
MRIVGLGLDATEVPRIAAMLEQYGDRFKQRVYTDGEIAYCDAKVKRAAVASYAARFAAKEAGMKAIGTGKSHGVLWRDIEVVRGRGGPPQLAFHGAARRHFDRLGATKGLVTITHTAELAIVHVMLIAE